jgi:hypothetical protein
MEMKVKMDSAWIAFLLAVLVTWAYVKSGERIDETQAEVQLLQGKVESLEKRNDSKLECIRKDNAK